MTAEQIQHIRTRLAALGAKQAELEAKLRKLERQQASARSNDRHPVLDANEPAVTASSSPAQKVALFRRLFAGRTDIFPACWDNRKTGRSGYSPALQRRFSRFVRNLVILRGGMSAAERKISEAALRVSDDEERLILATGRYIGEGFDDQRIDTLFLTMPISWKGKLAQYVRRLHRQHAGKTEVRVVDYVDETVPMLARMAAKRRTGYRALGYTIE